MRSAMIRWMWLVCAVVVVAMLSSGWRQTRAWGYYGGNVVDLGLVGAGIALMVHMVRRAQRPSRR